MKIRSLFITLGLLISSMLIHAAPPMMEHYKTHGHIYQPYELQDCHKKDISQSHRDIIRERLLIEFKKYCNDLIRIDIQDRQCAFNKKKQPLGSALLVYSTVQSLDKAHDEY